MTWAYSASTFNLAVFIYHTYSSSDFSQKSKIIWDGPTDLGLYQFTSSDRITLGLVKATYQYLRRRKQRRNTVQPINQSILPEPQITVDSLELRPSPAQEKVKLFEAVYALYKADTDKSAEMQFLEDIQHWKTTRKPTTAGDTETHKERIHLVPERKFKVAGYSGDSTPKID